MKILQASCSGVLVSVKVDDKDARLIGAKRISIGSHGYAQIWSDGKVHLLHRWLLGLTKGDGLVGDHINRDVLDNRRRNLRIVSPSESNWNRELVPAHRFFGVYPTRSGRWVARLKRKGVSYYLGTFDTEEEAHKAVKRFGEETP